MGAAYGSFGAPGPDPESIQQEYGVYQGDLIEEARAERDEDFDRIWRGEA